MADIVKLKKKAADLEAKKQVDKALEVYRAIVDAYEDGEEDTIDIPFYNRFGDLLQRQGNLPEAVAVWEKAVDHYAEGGFYNPAIALCNKILRQSPGRTVIYYKLGKINAEKGFKADARQNFLEYAGRQQKSGNLDEAFRALKEFADLVPELHDVRLMLADQLVKADRKDEALQQLQLGYAQATADSRDEAADELSAKMKEIDPEFEPKAEGASASGGSGGLVFLDLGSGEPEAPKARRSRGPTPGEVKRASKAVEGLELIEPPEILKAPAAPPTAPPEEIQTVEETAAAAPHPASDDLLIEPTAAQPEEPEEPIVADDLIIEPTVAEPPADALPVADELLIETTDLDEDTPKPRGSVAGLETTSLDEDVPPVEIEMPADDAGAEQTAEGEDTGAPVEIDASAGADDLQMIDVDPQFGDVNPFSDPDEAEEAASPSADLPLLGDEPGLTPAGEQFDEATEEVAALESEEEAVAGRTSAPSAGLPLLDTEEDDEPIVERPSARLSLSISAPVVEQPTAEELREKVAAAPEDWGARRQLAEALLETGSREEALAELEVAMLGFEDGGDLDTAGSIAEEIVRLEPTSIRYHKKRVEFAFRANDRNRLAEAYAALAGALFADGQAQQARAVYQRVLDINPDDVRAQAAIESIPEDLTPPPTPPRRPSSTTSPRRKTPDAPEKSPATRPMPSSDGDDYVSLGDWLRADDEPKSTRMVVEEVEPTGDEAADFADMLRKFKQGISDNVEDEDHAAHYDLGVAYKEMGLLDEAIAEFQKALRGTSERVRTFESLGHCFVEKGQLPVAATILQRALAEPQVKDEALVGVLYVLGAIAEEQGKYPDAKKYYERVFAVDIQFRDVGDRLNVVEQHLS